MTEFNFGFRYFALIAKIWLSPILEFFDSIAAKSDTRTCLDIARIAREPILALQVR
jgi:hypothetical protein